MGRVSSALAPASHLRAGRVSLRAAPALLWNHSVTLCNSCLPSALYSAKEHSGAASPIVIELCVRAGVKTQPSLVAAIPTWSTHWLPYATLGESSLQVTAFNITPGVCSIRKVEMINPDLLSAGVVKFVSVQTACRAISSIICKRMC